MINDTAAIAMASLNSSAAAGALPPLPEYTVKLAGDYIPGIPNYITFPLLPIVMYWIPSAIFHIIDVYDLLPQYRLHTPEEIAKRNHVSRWECLRDVIIQQIIQFAITCILDEPQLVGKEDHDIAVWATRVRLAQRALPQVLGLVGLNASAISKNMAASHPLIAGALAGGHYPSLTTVGLDGADAVPTFAAWELLIAQAIYWIAIPGLQLFLATLFVDTWQYALHRLMHTNRWMYTHLHSRHHRLYVPYAYGALYNHPVEGFLLDTLGTGAAFKATMMSPRLGLFFFCFSTLKTVDDHCGYALPWDPLQMMSSNNAAYHDIHHQTWGIKSNFSQPFFTFWDAFLGTQYKGNRKNRLQEAQAKKTAEAAAAVAANVEKKTPRTVAA